MLFIIVNNRRHDTKTKQWWRQSTSGARWILQLYTDQPPEGNYSHWRISSICQQPFPSAETVTVQNRNEIPVRHLPSFLGFSRYAWDLKLRNSFPTCFWRGRPWCLAIIETSHLFTPEHTYVCIYSSKPYTASDHTYMCVYNSKINACVVHC